MVEYLDDISRLIQLIHPDTKGVNGGTNYLILPLSMIEHHSHKA